MKALNSYYLLVSFVVYGGGEGDKSISMSGLSRTHDNTYQMLGQSVGHMIAMRQQLGGVLIVEMEVRCASWGKSVLWAVLLKQNFACSSFYRS